MKKVRKSGVSKLLTGTAHTHARTHTNVLCLITVIKVGLSFLFAYDITHCDWSIKQGYRLQGVTALLFNLYNVHWLRGENPVGL